MKAQKEIPEDESKYDIITDRTVKGGFWVFLIRIADEIFYLVKLLILARILTPTDFGLVGVATLTLSILNNFSRTGFERAIVQKKGDIKPYLDSAWTVTIIRGIAIFTILFFCAPLVSYLFHAPESMPIIQVIGLTTVLASFTNMGFFYFDRELEFKKRFIYQTSGTIVDFIVTIISILLFQNVWALITGMIAGNAAKLVVSYIIHPYRPRLSSDFHKAKELWGFGQWIFFSTILAFFIQESDDIFVGIILGVTALGFYQMAYKISNLPATEITEIVNRVTFSAYAKLQDERAKLSEGYLKVLKFTAFSSFLIGSLIFVLAPDFTRIFLGEKWMPMVLAMQALVLWGITRSIGSSTISLFEGIGKPRVISKMQIIQIILMAILIYPLTISYDIFGTSMSVVFSALIVNLGYYFLVIRELNCTKWSFFKLIIFPLISSITMILTVIIIETNWILKIGIIEFFIIGGIGILVYICIIAIFEKIFDYKIIREGISVAKKLITQKI
ncbi:MAG: lipopolysaccharide biosynthesis protein [Promethearchaeota archaeon]